MLDDYLDVLTIDDVAEILRISRSSVNRLLKTGALTYRKIGRLYRISKVSVIEFLQNTADEKSK